MVFTSKIRSVLVSVITAHENIVLIYSRAIEINSDDYDLVAYKKCYTHPASKM